MGDEFLVLSRTAFRRLYGLEVEPVAPVDPAAVNRWFAMARRNRVAGLWADTLPLSEWKSSVASEWHRQACGQMLHSARLTAEAERIVKALEKSVEGLRLVKGPALAAQAWPRPGLRSFDDLDFRCAKDSLDTVTAGLLALGYQIKEENVRHQQNLWHFGWGVSFRHSNGFLVEFNHRMFPPHYPWPDRLTCHTPDLWCSIMLDTRTVDCPVPALHLLLSSVHAIWHGWERLGWLVDIAGLLVRQPGLFAEAERLAARNIFLCRALRCACNVTQQIFGPLPGLPGFKADPLVDQALELLMRSGPDIPLSIQRQIHHRLMPLRQSILYTIRRLATPGDTDFKQGSLSGRLRGLYWALRPARGLRKLF